MNPDFLPASLPETIAISNPVPGYPVLQVETPHSVARIALHGAHVIDWKPRGSDPVLYLSPEAVYRSGKAIRGGIPVCWPWFGAHPDDPSRPAHGLARSRFWKLDRAAADPEFAELDFVLPADEALREVVPAGVTLRLQVRVGASLELRLTTRNGSKQPLTLTQALHTYLAVGSIGQTRVEGLEGATYLDTLPEPKAVLRETGSVTFSGEVDRIYRTSGALEIVDAAKDRTLRLSSSGSDSAVVWNPWMDKAARLTDLPDDAYHDFVCVETANAWEDARTIAEGRVHTLGMTLQVV